MKIIGTLTLSNGAGLKYPYVVTIYNMSKFCDEVIVGVDPDFPQDIMTISKLPFPNVKVHLSKWDRTRLEGGREIAIQIELLNKLAEEQGADWIVSLQADELLLDQEFSSLRYRIETAPEDVIGLRTERIYFWKDFETIRKDWNADLVRIFRAGSHSFLAENTDKSGMYSAPIVPGRDIDAPEKIYHYSRIGDPLDISIRVRNADTFFHEEEDLTPVEDLEPYTFKARQYDNFSMKETPPEVEGEFVKYYGPHPEGLKEWYEG